MRILPRFYDRIAAAITTTTTAMISKIIVLFCALFLGIVVRGSREGDDNIHFNPEIGTLHRRTYFYVGGSYHFPNDTTEAAISSGQMYVEHLVPEFGLLPGRRKRKYPIVMIHGNGMTGTNFLNTPDGKPGWADYFLHQGYELYIIDQPSRGRSPFQASIDGNPGQFTFDTTTIESRFTATARFNLWPQAHLQTQWPGNGSKGDPFFDAFYKSTVPSLASNVEASWKMKTAGAELLDKIGPTIIMTHSQSGQYGWPLADTRPQLVKGIIALEPMGPPFTNVIFPPFTKARPYGLTEIPIEFSPPIQTASNLQTVVVESNDTMHYQCIQQASPARKLVNLENIPVLFVTSESGYHSVYDSCSVRFLREGGVRVVDHIKLDEDAGIHGNGHMMFMENNRFEIADKVVEKWLKEKFSD